MRSTVMHAAGDVRVQDRDDPTIAAPTDAIIRLTATCVCGSDLWPYRGADASTGRLRWATNTSASSRRSASTSPRSSPASSSSGRSSPPTTPAPICLAGYQSSCLHRESVGANGAQPQYLRVPLADGTLVATPEVPVR